jgi:3D (Asp-Asp-Asp) domain-containing protein
MLMLLTAIMLQGPGYARTRTDAPRRTEVTTGWRRFVATAYSQAGETASQTITQEGRTLAADPNVLPIGTVVEVRNAGPYSGEYVVQDTGEKIVGRKVDIFIASTKECRQFGRRRVQIRVLRPAPATPREQREAAAVASVAPKPPKSERVSEYYQYPPSTAGSDVVQ